MDTYCTVNQVNLGTGLQIFIQKQEAKLHKPTQQIQNTSDEQLSALAWQRNMPFVNTWHIQQLETLAWQHSNYWGLRMQEYKSLDRGTVIQQHVLNYQRALPEGCLGVYDNIRQYTAMLHLFIN